MFCSHDIDDSKHCDTLGWVVLILMLPNTDILVTGSGAGLMLQKCDIEDSKHCDTLGFVDLILWLPNTDILVLLLVLMLQKCDILVLLIILPKTVASLAILGHLHKHSTSVLKC